MILILEDDADINDSLREVLQNNGYEVAAAHSVAEFDEMWKECGSTFRLLLLDVRLPDGSGFDVCRNVRCESSIPIIFLTSYDDEESVVEGLNIGGDDYISKPFKISELLSRIAANIRRFNLSVGNLYQKGDLTIDFGKYKIEKNGHELNISTKEFEIIKLLLENKGRVVRRDYLYENIWDNQGNFVEYNTLTVAMSRIKAKLGTYGSENKPYIETLRNVGYCSMSDETFGKQAADAFYKLKINSANVSAGTDAMEKAGYGRNAFAYISRLNGETAVNVTEKM